MTPRAKKQPRNGYLRPLARLFNTGNGIVSKLMTPRPKKQPRSGYRKKPDPRNREVRAVYWFLHFFYKELQAFQCSVLFSSLLNTELSWLDLHCTFSILSPLSDKKARARNYQTKSKQFLMSAAIFVNYQMILFRAIQRIYCIMFQRDHISETACSAPV